MKQKLEKVLELVNNTEEKIILFDQKTDRAFVVMSYDMYDQLRERADQNKDEVNEDNSLKLENDIKLWETTKQELLDPANGSIGASQQEEKEIDTTKDTEIVNLSGQSEGTYYFEELDDNKNKENKPSPDSK